jgi:hypothetical protein
LIEGCREAEMFVAGFYAEFVVAAPQVLNERVATDHH